MHSGGGIQEESRNVRNQGGTENKSWFAGEKIRPGKVLLVFNTRIYVEKVYLIFLKTSFTQYVSKKFTWYLSKLVFSFVQVLRLTGSANCLAQNDIMFYSNKANINQMNHDYVI